MLLTDVENSSNDVGKITGRVVYDAMLWLDAMGFHINLKSVPPFTLVLPCGVVLSWGTMKRRRWWKDVAKCRILRHSAINHSGGSTMLCIVLWNRLMKYTGDQLLHTRLASVLL